MVLSSLRPQGEIFGASFNTLKIRPFPEVVLRLRSSDDDRSPREGVDGAKDERDAERS
jgi:hypothetical protein